MRVQKSENIYSYKCARPPRFRVSSFDSKFLFSKTLSLFTLNSRRSRKQAHKSGWFHANIWFDDGVQVLNKLCDLVIISTVYLLSSRLKAEASQSRHVRQLGVCLLTSLYILKSKYNFNKKQLVLSYLSEIRSC